MWEVRDVGGRFIMGGLYWEFVYTSVELYVFGFLRELEYVGGKSGGTNLSGDLETSVGMDYRSRSTSVKDGSFVLPMRRERGMKTMRDTVDRKEKLHLH